MRTRATWPIAYSSLVETTAYKALVLIPVFNHFERKMGMEPVQLRMKPKLHCFKSEVIVAVRFARKVVNKLRHG